VVERSYAAQIQHFRAAADALVLAYNSEVARVQGNVHTLNSMQAEAPELSVRDIYTVCGGTFLTEARSARPPALDYTAADPSPADNTKGKANKNGSDAAATHPPVSERAGTATAAGGKVFAARPLRGVFGGESEAQRQSDAQAAVRCMRRTRRAYNYDVQRRFEQRWSADSGDADLHYASSSKTSRQALRAARRRVRQAAASATAESEGTVHTQLYVELRACLAAKLIDELALWTPCLYRYKVYSGIRSHICSLLSAAVSDSITVFVYVIKSWWC
jgi:hypothetical protein